MAKTKATATQPGSAVGDWTPAALIGALRSGRTGDRVAALKRSGILTRGGKLAPRFRSWGSRKVSRTPSAKEMGVKREG